MIPFRYLQLLIIQQTKGNISMTGTLKRILENSEWILLSLTIIWGQSLLLLNAVVLFWFGVVFFLFLSFFFFVFFFFWGSELLNFSRLLEGVAGLLAEKSTWNYSLGEKKGENCLIRPIFQPTNPATLPVLNCWPLPSVSCNVAGTLPSNKDPCYLIRMYLLKVIMVQNRYLAMWNTISSLKMWRFGA